MAAPSGPRPAQQIRLERDLLWAPAVMSKEAESMIEGAQAPAVVRRSVLDSSVKVDELTGSIGAQLLNVNLGDASRDKDLAGEIQKLLLKYKVLFLRNQKITRQEHVAFASHFGKLEDHPMAPSHPEAPGLVQIYKTPDKPNDRYENAWHTDAT